MIARIPPFARVSAYVLAAAMSSPLAAQSPRYAENAVPNNSLRQPSLVVPAANGTEAPLFFPMNPNPPHLVLEAPRPRPQAAIDAQSGHPGASDEAVWVEPGYENSPPPEQTHTVPGSRHVEDLKNKFLHADKREQPVAIPNANRIPVWKTPYSYGHFGTSRNRQWSLHRGHKESYMQWSLR